MLAGAGAVDISGPQCRAEGTTQMTTTTNDRPFRLPTGRTTRLAVLAAALAGAAMGCDSSQLETGYQYRRLGASDNERRAYYAPEYSREAAMAGAQRESSDVSNMAKRRPGSSQY
jgi:hypothetical protein